MLMLLKKIRIKHLSYPCLTKKRIKGKGKLSLGVLLTEVLGGIDHVGKSALDLIPFAGLETAVRVDPELVRAEVGKHLLDALLELLLVGDTRAVNVIDTGSDMTGVGLIDEDLEELGIRLGVLNGENIGVERSDGVEEVLEF